MSERLFNEIVEPYTAGQVEKFDKAYQWKDENVVDEKTKRFKQQVYSYINNFNYMSKDFDNQIDKNMGYDIEELRYKSYEMFKRLGWK